MFTSMRNNTGNNKKVPNKPTSTEVEAGKLSVGDVIVLPEPQLLRIELVMANVDHVVGTPVSTFLVSGLGGVFGNVEVYLHVSQDRLVDLVSAQKTPAAAASVAPPPPKPSETPRLVAVNRGDLDEDYAN